jgi:hypothetical protein
VLGDAHERAQLWQIGGLISEENLCTGAARRDLGVAAESLDDLGGPRLELAVRVAGIEIDAAERPAVAELGELPMPPPSPLTFRLAQTSAELRLPQVLGSSASAFLPVWGQYGILVFFVGSSSRGSMRQPTQRGWSSNSASAALMPGPPVPFGARARKAT